jgi:hypothetical protein
MRPTPFRCGLALALATACTEVPAPADGGGGPSDDAPCVYCQPSCPSPDQAPLRGADGGTACTRVGASAGDSADPWPDPAGAAAPIAYVGPADGPRTPSGEAPLPDLAAALALSPRPATILVARGTYPLAGPLRIAASVVIRGMGPDRTALAGAAGADAIAVTAIGAQATEVSLEALAVRFDGAPGAGAAFVGVRATGATTTLRLRDVEVARAGEGLRAESGATVCARGLTVRQSGRFGVALADGSHGYLRDLLVRDGAGVGVAAGRSHLAIDTGLVADNARDGVVLSGTVSGDRCDGACPTAPACEGFRHEQTCAASLALPERPRLANGDGGFAAIPAESRCRSVSLLANVALLRNHVTGLRAARTAPTAAEDADYVRRNTVLAAPGPVVRATRLLVAGTGVPDGSVGGYGVYVGPTSRVSFDPDIATEAERGAGSAIVDNAGAGVLADGDPSGDAGGVTIGDAAIPDELLRAGTLAMAGALVGSNRGPGVFVQRRAVAEFVSYSTLADNAVMALGVSSGALGRGFCDQFIGTRPGTFPAAAPGMAPFRFGDGVGLSEATPRPEPWRAVVATEFADSEFSGNGRYGVVLSGSDATLTTLRLGNRGSDNQFGVGVYGGARLVGESGAIRGRAPAPAEFRGSASDYVRVAGSL